MSAIVHVVGREILDSRGNPTVEVEVELDSGARVSGWVLGEEIEHLKPDGRLRAVPHDGQGLQFVHT